MSLGTQELAAERDTARRELDRVQELRSLAEQNVHTLRVGRGGFRVRVLGF